MKLYKIANLTVALECQERTMKRAERYSLNCKSGIIPDITIKTTCDEIAAISKPEWTEEIKAYIYEGKVFYTELAEKYNGIMLHASAVAMDNKAYLFSAPSGTGKSTHTKFWLEKFGDKAFILNDDKPAVRIIDKTVYAYGTPWSGKDDISVNTGVEVAGIFFLNRGSQNQIYKLDEIAKITNLYQACLKNVDMKTATAQMEVFTKLIELVPIFKMQCTPTMDSVNVVYDFMKRYEANAKKQ